MIAAAASARRNRWAVSFADLLLLLLKGEMLLPTVSLLLGSPKMLQCLSVVVLLLLHLS